MLGRTPNYHQTFSGDSVRLSRLILLIIDVQINQQSKKQVHSIAMYKIICPWALMISPQKIIEHPNFLCCIFQLLHCTGVRGLLVARPMIHDICSNCIHPSGLQMEHWTFMLPQVCCIDQSYARMFWQCLPSMEVFPHFLFRLLEDQVSFVVDVELLLFLGAVSRLCLSPHQQQWCLSSTRWTLP